MYEGGNWETGITISIPHDEFYPVQCIENIVWYYETWSFRIMLETLELINAKYVSPYLSIKTTYLGDFWDVYETTKEKR